MIKNLLIITIFIFISACDDSYNPFNKKTLTFNERVDQAKIELDNKNYGESIEITLKIIDEDPKNSQAFYVKSQAKSVIGLQQEAIEALAKAMENGFVDFKALQENKNFDKIRNLKEYRELLIKYDQDFSYMSITNDDIDINGEVSINNIDGKQVIKAGDVSISLPN